jgi:hypothetical protein
MVDALTPAYLRHRARYWRSRAERETDSEKQARFKQTAVILEKEAAERSGREHGSSHGDQP